MLQTIEQKIMEVVEKVVPSVVSVTTTTLARARFSQVVPVKGQGSGVIISEDGFILTNAHVVEGVRDVSISLHDGRHYQAVVVGESRTRDVAILKINADKITPIEIGKSSELKQGQFAIAIGNPLGLGSTVTFGMVSALDRTIRGQNAHLEGLIQTSAQINPGNSGGALVDTDGKLIGMPTAMIQWSQGIGFAIAIDSIMDVYEELVQTGTIQTPWMGIVGVTVNGAIAENYRLPVDTGALLVELPRGPSSKAGLKPGDVIIGIDDEEIKDMEHLRTYILTKKVGEKLRVRFARDRDVFEVYVALSPAP
ncbi:MAG: trypsin-like peptidase domain-containing protein [Candidatus Thorarchaeota archaeon]|nr:trypsin-like peptidase domain-containing protein [Candidatus Thorarchaeota archaeon]